MFTHLLVTDDDLRLLAQRRAQAVKYVLVASKQVEPNGRRRTSFKHSQF